MPALGSLARTIGAPHWQWILRVPHGVPSGSPWFRETSRIERSCFRLHSTRGWLVRKQLSHHRCKATFADVAEPTIYALSSAPGRAAIAVIRVSGPDCWDIYRSLCPGKKDLTPRLATVRTLYAPNQAPTQATVLDSSALLLYFPSPATATGEDILELHVHGGPAIVKAVLAAIPKCSHRGVHPIRYAEPGEFTRRAFMNGRLDLTQVEALGDTLSADTEQQRQLSIRGTTGHMAKRYEAWRQTLLAARGELEALIDFSEDQHFDESPSELCASVAGQVQVLMSHLDGYITNANRGELLRHGLSVSFLGAPNAGKSSLLNRIVGREAAIVSTEAGTTRDVVEVGLDVGGYFCRLSDTAGLRPPPQDAHPRSRAHGSDPISHIEREGMRRAKERAAESDVVVVVLSFEPMADGSVGLRLDPEVCATAAHLVRAKANVIVVVNKTDLTNPSRHHQASSAVRAIVAALPGLDKQRIHMVSCIEPQRQRDPAAGATPRDTTAPTPTNAHRRLDADGIQAFLHGLTHQFAQLTTPVVPAAGEAAPADPDPSGWAESLGATARHRLLLEGCVDHLQAFLAEAVSAPASSLLSSEPEQLPVPDAGADGSADADIVLAAEHLRFAADCLAKITGRGAAGDVEEVLGVVFEKFCVGK